MIYTIRSLIGDAHCSVGVPYGARTWWVRAVPLPYYGDYFAAAWAVLRGRAVAVRYPVSGELEAALAETGGITVPGLSSTPAQEQE